MSGARKTVERVVVARVDEIPANSRKIVTVAGKEIGIFNVDGRFYAVLNTCPHLGGPLCAGTVISFVSASRPGELRLERARKVLTCPWHAWEFDLETGEAYTEAGRMKMRLYPIVRMSSVTDACDATSTAGLAAPMARGERPETTKEAVSVETFPVDVRGEYLVLSIARRT